MAAAPRRAAATHNRLIRRKRRELPEPSMPPNIARSRPRSSPSYLLLTIRTAPATRLRFRLHAHRNQRRAYGMAFRLGSMENRPGGTDRPGADRPPGRE